MAGKNRQINGFSIAKESKLCKQFLESTRDGVALMPVDDNGTIGNFTFANASFCEMFGFTYEELSGMNLSDLTPSEKDKENTSIVDGILRVKKLITERDLLRNGGSSIPVRIRASVVDIHGRQSILLMMEDLTEQKLTERLLNDWGEYFKSIFLTSTAPIILTRFEDGRIEEVSESFTEIFGYTGSEAIGRTTLELNLWKEPEERERFAREVRKRGSINDQERTFLAKDGTERDVLLSAKILILGEHLHILMVVTNVSHLKKTQRELQAREARYRLLADNSFDVIWTMDLDFNFTYISPSIERMTGFTPEEAIAQPLEKFFTKTSLEKIKAVVLKNLELERSEDADPNRNEILELEIFYKDGPTIWGEVSASFIRGENGEVIGIQGVTRDITERKLSDLALKETEEHFRQIFMQTDDAVLILDGEDLHVLDSNPAALEYGFTQQEISHTGVGLLMSEADFEKWHETLLTEKNKDIISMDRITFEKKSGETVSVSFRGQRIRLADSELVFCSFRDITDRIRTEEEAKLMQAKLIQGNKMTSLGLMVSSVAHDINNPNNYIMFNSRIVSDFLKDALPILEEYCGKHEGVVLGGLSAEEFGDTLPQLLEGISDGTRMITRIVNDLKDFVRQNLKTVENDVNINEVVERSSSLIENHIRKFTEKFGVELTENVPPIRGNKQQLVQVLVNIILNALESLPDKKHGVYVHTMPSSDGNHVEIQVRDEGCGMSREVQARALDPFFSTRLDKGGTGLGLTICNSILREHEGAMLIRSIIGEGTTITLVLPTEKYYRECYL